MPRIDFPNAISKRGSLPRILSSSKKNSLLSPLNTSFIAGEWEDSRGDPSSRQNPLKQEAEYGEYHNSTSPSTARAIKRSTSLLPLRTRRIFTPPLTGTKPEIETKESEVIDNCQEIRVNKMITVRRGPQVHIPIRKVRCQLTAPAITLETSDSSVPTPNEILIALVDFFAPPTEVKGKLTELEQQATFLDDPHITTAEQMSLDDSMEYLRHSPMNSISCVQHPSVTASTKAVFKHKVDEDDINGSQIPYFSQASGMTGNQSSAGTDLSMKCEPKHPPLTLGGVIGSRRQRSTSQSYNNSQTLDQLNPSLAEALAAMRSKSDITSKSFGTSQNSSDWFSNRRESLPTRMSGPVKLEAVTPTNSSSTQCANGSTSGHLVSFNGHTTEVPEEIRCHLCDYPMKLCIRKSKYKGEIREYAAYRCLRKGCQTFRSVRKVIDPDFPCPRKRKFEEVFDPGNVSSHVSAKTDDGRTGHSNFVRSNLSSKAEGTLLYIPGRVSYEQVEQMQKFAIGILGKIGGTTVDNVSKPLFAYVNMTAQDIDDNLRTDDGQKKLQHIIMHSPQPPLPGFEVLQSRMDLPSPFNPFTSVSQVTKSVFNPSRSFSQTRVSIPTTSAYTQSSAPPSTIFAPNPCTEIYPDSYIPTLQTAPHSVCGMAMQALVPNFKSHHQYTNGLIW